MKKIVILLLMICLAKFAGAQTPKPASHRDVRTNLATAVMLDVDSAKRAASQRETFKAKTLFIGCLLAGLLVATLASGRVFSRETHPDRFNLNNG